MRIASKKGLSVLAGATLALVAGLVVADRPSRAVAADGPSAIVEDFSYPGAAAILAEHTSS
jgi:hypothetical protein